VSPEPVAEADRHDIADRDDIRDVVVAFYRRAFAAHRIAGALQRRLGGSRPVDIASPGSR
jgi:hypothetical protein